MNKSAKVALIVSTICILLINLANLIEFLDTGDAGSIISNVCIIFGDICLIIAWVSFFLDKKKQ